MTDVVCIAAGRQVDGKGNLERLDRRLTQAESLLNAPVRQLIIDPLSVDWHSDLQADHFRSGCAPIEALEQACHLIKSGREGAALIRGTDYLRSGYSSAERRAAMAIYDWEMPLTEAYDQLAKQFAKHWNI